MAHLSNICYNAINQRFWLQYHNQKPTVFGTMDAHLITPYYTSKDQEKQHHLVPNQARANITRSDTYIHGHFEFAVVQGHKTCD
jgi:hypothetical protein